MRDFQKSPLVSLFQQYILLGMCIQKKEVKRKEAGRTEITRLSFTENTNWKWKIQHAELNQIHLFTMKLHGWVKLLNLNKEKGEAWSEVPKHWQEIFGSTCTEELGRLLYFFLFLFQFKKKSYTFSKSAATAQKSRYASLFPELNAQIKYLFVFCT